MLHITSDTHVGHRNILGFASCNKFRKDLYGPKEDPESIQRMDDGIVAVWNENVKPEDIVYHLGDVVLAYGKKQEKELYLFLERVYGHIILLNGNHDNNKTRGIFREFGHDVDIDYRELDLFDNKIIMSHYPLAAWNKGQHGSVMLHGHSHGSYKAPGGRILDVGWDVHGRPLRLKEAYDIAMKEEIFSADHH